MAQKKVGALIKEARTAAGLTQEKLAKTAGEKLTAADISKCEQGKADLTTAQLKAVAKACGVTQSSLVNAPKNLTGAAGKAAAEKTAAAKTAAAKSFSPNRSAGCAGKMREASRGGSTSGKRSEREKRLSKSRKKKGGSSRNRWTR